MSSSIELLPGIFVKTNLPMEEAKKIVQNHFKNKKPFKLGEDTVLFFEVGEKGSSIYRGPAFSINLEHDLLEQVFH